MWVISVIYGSWSPSGEVDFEKRASYNRSARRRSMTINNGGRPAVPVGLIAELR